MHTPFPEPVGQCKLLILVRRVTSKPRRAIACVNLRKSLRTRRSSFRNISIVAIIVTPGFALRRIHHGVELNQGLRLGNGSAVVSRQLTKGFILTSSQVTEMTKKPIFDRIPESGAAPEWIRETAPEYNQ